MIMQGILGGITVLYFLPPAVSTAHAALGQTFFCLAAIIAIYNGDMPALVTRTNNMRSAASSLLRPALMSVGVLYVQLILGGLFRHGGLSWWPHVANSSVVIAALTWTSFLALAKFKTVDQIRKPALLILFLLTIQVCLGGAAFYTRVLQDHEPQQPELPMVIFTVAHVSFGALLLTTMVILALRAWLIDSEPASAFAS
jgi:heme A synthase